MTDLLSRRASSPGPGGTALWLLAAGWTSLVAGAALMPVPFLGLLGLVAAPAGAALLTAAALRAPGDVSRGRRWLGGLLSAAGTLGAAALTAQAALDASWLALGWQRAGQFGSAGTTPTTSAWAWAVLAGLDALAVACVALGAALRRRTGRWLWVAVGLAPPAALGAVLVLGRVLPLSD